MSEPFSPGSGVPQGFSCGSLLFTIYINPLVSGFEIARCLMYADDIKTFCRINSETDAIRLQRDLDMLNLRSNNICFEFRIEKCVILSFSRGAIFDYKYSLNN